VESPPAATWTAKPIVVGAIWGLSMLVSIVVIDLFPDSAWKWLVVPVPVLLLGYFVRVLVETVRRPDPARVDAPDL
jgi:hypothetical protein